MSVKYKSAASNAEEYARRRDIALLEQIGSGQDGVVFSTTQKTVVKAFLYDPQYVREKQVYGRIEECDINSIGEFSIPRLIDTHDELLVIEMEFVTAPFIVDFAGAYLDEPLDYPQEILRQWETKWRDQRSP